MSTSSTSPNSSLTGSPLLTLAAAIGMILMLIPCPAVAVPVSVSIKSPGHRHRRTIVNGSTAGQNEYQYASSIQFGSRHICGASLIAPDIILSAAHCFIEPGDYRDGRFTVVIGEYHLQDREDTGQVFLVEKIHVHPDYLETLQYLENDVMLMKIIGRSERKIVKLNHNPNLPVLAIDADALTVVGWGSLDTKGVIMANVLQEVQLGYISNQECHNRGIPLVTDQMMCAADIDGDSLTEDSCYGDSGGPLILTDPSVASRNKDVQVGIVSFGSKTCGTYPGVYTRISSVYGWIRHGVCNLSIDAPFYFQCDKIEKIAPTTSPTWLNQSLPSVTESSPSTTSASSSRSTAMPSNAPSNQKPPTPIPSASTNEPTSSPSISVPVATNEPTSSPSISVPVATNEPTTSDSQNIEKKETQSYYSQSHNNTTDVDKETGEKEQKAVYVVLGPSTSNGNTSSASQLDALQLLSFCLVSVGSCFIMKLI